MTREKFVQMIFEHGVIGAPCQGIEAVAEFVRDPEIKIEFKGPVGDVIARAYWAHGSHGGCISIPREGI